ncbi:hypothetical protein ACJJIU_02645 [Microbulbifer sp. CnH-101-E]|uniref:hypothetical protein n=1 Tax=unclassified Microbulbifer TaxID=2619833 RepID=UPI00403A5C3C
MCRETVSIGQLSWVKSKADGYRRRRTLSLSSLFNLPALKSLKSEQNQEVIGFFQAKCRLISISGGGVHPNLFPLIDRSGVGKK